MSAFATFAELMADELAYSSTLSAKKAALAGTFAHGRISGVTGRPSVHVRVTVAPSTDPDNILDIDLCGTDIGTTISIANDRLADMLSESYWGQIVEGCLGDFEPTEYSSGKDRRDAASAILDQLARNFRQAIKARNSAFFALIGRMPKAGWNSGQADACRLHGTPRRRMAQPLAPRNDWAEAVAAVCGRRLGQVEI